MEAPVPPESTVYQEHLGFSTPAICLSTYLSESCYRGRLFDQSTYKVETFHRFMDRFAEDIIGPLALPPAFDREATMERLRQELRNWSEEYRKTLESTDTDDGRSVKKTIEKSKAETEAEFDELVGYFRQDDFPPVLWMELLRARQVFADSVRFLLERMKNWFTFSPQRTSQSSRRSKLTQAMMKPYLPHFQEFAVSIKTLFRTLLFIEIWSCDNEKELFTDKRWTLKNVDEPAFEAMFMDLRHTVSSLRENYFAMSQKKPAAIDTTKPVPCAFRQLVILAEA